MGLCLTTGSPEKTKAPVCSACWFLWCNFSHRGWFAATIMRVLKEGPGKLCPCELGWAGSSTPWANSRLWGGSYGNQHPQQGPPFPRDGSWEDPTGKQQEAVREWLLTTHCVSWHLSSYGTKHLSRWLLNLPPRATWAKMIEIQTIGDAGDQILCFRTFQGRGDSSSGHVGLRAKPTWSVIGL